MNDVEEILTYGGGGGGGGGICLMGVCVYLM